MLSVKSFSQDAWRIGFAWLDNLRVASCTAASFQLAQPPPCAASVPTDRFKKKEAEHRDAMNDSQLLAGSLCAYNRRYNRWTVRDYHNRPITRSRPWITRAVAIATATTLLHTHTIQCVFCCLATATILKFHDAIASVVFPKVVLAWNGCVLNSSYSCSSLNKILLARSTTSISVRICRVLACCEEIKTRITDIPHGSGPLSLREKERVPRSID